jgi:hypothetical protein
MKFNFGWSFDFWIKRDWNINKILCYNRRSLLYQRINVENYLNFILKLSVSFQNIMDRILLYYILTIHKEHFSYYKYPKWKQT